MKLSEYLSDRKFLIILYFTVSLFTGAVIYLRESVGLAESSRLTESAGLAESNGLYVVVVALFLFAIFLAIEFLQKMNYYGKCKEASFAQGLDWINSLPLPMNTEQRICQELLQKLYQDANDKLAEYHLKSAEDLEFVITWVHEIKTPIAASKLIIENSLNNPAEESLSEEAHLQEACFEKVLFSIEDEIGKMEGFVQMVLFYTRAGDFARDYMISSINLEKIVNDCVKTEYSGIKNKNLKMNLGHLDLQVESDEKWLGFIVKQVLDNAVKYSASGGEIRVYAEHTEKEGILVVEDSGIGIKQEDIGRIFDKNFTGANGRRYNASTGIGLYLSQKLARKLGHSLTAVSGYGHGTRISIHFPKWNDYFEI